MKQRPKLQEGKQTKTNMNIISESAVLTKARSLLRDVEVLRYDGKGHSVIDISLLRTIPDDELIRHRNVGKATIEKIREIRKSLEWV